MAESPHAGARISSSDLAAQGQAVRANATWPNSSSSRATNSGSPTLQAWDIAYASEKLRIARYAFSDQEVKQYFPETTVLPGHVPRGRNAVRHHDRAGRGAQVASGRALFQHHATARQSWSASSTSTFMRGHQSAAARGWTTRSRAGAPPAASRRRSPISIAISPRRSAKSTAKAPALFTHDEVITLFHEFGHGLHHLLTRVEELGVSGINGVEWDAVELPSQFMENFCWEWDVLVPMTRHVDTGAPLPRALFDKMLAAKNFQSGMQMVRQIEFALFDMHLHFDFDPHGRRDRCRRCSTTCAAQVAVVIPPAFNRFPQQLLAHFRRRLRGGLLQLQVGGSTVGGRLQPVRGARRARSPRPAAGSATKFSPSAAAGRRSNRSSRFAGASRA